MRPRLREAFTVEMTKAIKAYDRAAFDEAFTSLERAHILGQKYVIAHTRSHWWMLKVAARKRDRGEILGQCLRILGSMLLSRIWVPVGNTGRANVKATKRMPIPEDLQAILNDS